MKTEKTTTTVTLTLTEEEAYWLAGVMEQPINYEQIDPYGEDIHEKEMRLKYFQAVREK